VPLVSRVSTTLAPTICMAAAKAGRSPSCSCSFILRTRMKRPGIKLDWSMACRAMSMTQGKYWAALISSVTA